MKIISQKALLGGILPCILSVSFASAESFKIQTIEYEGLNHLSPLIANEIIQIKAGDTFDVQKVDSSIKNLYQQGYFKDIWVTEEKGRLVYHFVEKPIIASLIVSGYGAGKEPEVLEAEIGLKKGDVFDELKMANTKKRVIALLESQGFYDTIVEFKTEEISEKALKVTLEINKGEEIIIRKANYYGRENVKISRIESVTANKEREFLGWMWGFNSGKVQINELESDALRIQDIYLQKGYLDARVDTPFLRTDFTTYNAELDYYIEEGQQYKISEVEIVQEEEVIDNKELYDELKLTQKQVFNIEKMRKDTEAIRTKIGDLGYAFVRVTPDLDKNQDTKEVRIIYYIQPGSKVKVRDVIISGNSRTLDRVIRRNVLLAPGDEYQMSKIQRSKNAIMRTGGFDSVEIEEKRIDEEHLDLLVNIKEAKTGEFLFGVGYGSYDGLMGSVSIKDRNIFGSGQTAGIYFDKSEVSTSYRINLYNPAVLDSDYSLATDVYQTDYTDYDYREKTTGFSLFGGRNFTDEFSGSVGYIFQESELSDFQNDLYKDYYDGRYTKSSIVPGLSYDNTDAYFFPRNGWKASGSVEFAGVGGDSEFIKYFGSLYYYKSLLDWTDLDLIFRVRSKLGYIEDTGYLSILDKFYLGGVSTLRGYKSRSLTPRDSRGARIGGKETWYNSVELSYGLFDTVQMRLGAFYDYGMIGQERFNQIERSSAGVMLEWISPIGAINFIVPRALDKKPGDDTSSFEFTMGNRF